MPFDPAKFRALVKADPRPAYKIAAEAGVPQSTVARLMRVDVHHNPTTDTLDLFALVLGCSPKEFLSDPRPGGAPHPLSNGRSKQEPIT